ncbi:MAG: DUF1003 domain-containing protein [Terriglobia bacterium]
MAKATCSVCGVSVETRHLVNPQKLEEGLVKLIEQEHPQWDAKRGVCPQCREKYRAKKFLGYLEDEYQKISEMERNLVSKIARRGRVSKEVNEEYEEKMSLGDRVADRVAQFGGSWTFILLFAGVLLTWMFINSLPLILHKPFDPYPFILLNLVLSTLAAIQAPIIMMSQNRQSDKDRLHAQHDYEINLMAEMEIRDLHDKLDSLRYKQWHELWQMQQRQLEVMELMQKHLESHLRPPLAASTEVPASPGGDGNGA